MNKKKESDSELVEFTKGAYRKITDELSKVIVGQTEILRQLLIALLANGHCLIIGVPGLAKTLIINTLSKILDLKFQRIQFTPDLMPSDIIGTEIIEEEKSSGKRIFRFVSGPVFANIILADEINRTPPKTQSALLQAMQEYAVTTNGVTYPLDLPFFVLATQNPIEQEGTYPLPEAQLDRFMFSLKIDYPEKDEEMTIVKNTTSSYSTEVTKVLSKEKILNLQQIIRKFPVSDDIIGFAVDIVNRTRPTVKDNPDFIKKWVEWGAGPRASQYLILGGKANAILKGKFFTEKEDILDVVHPVLRHRIITNFNAEADGVKPDDIISKLIK